MTQPVDRIGHGKSLWRAAATGKFDLPRSYPADCGVQNEIGIFARSAICFDVSNVAEYFFAGSDQDYWEWGKDFPCLAPPFETMWMEYSAPSGIRAEGAYREAKDLGAWQDLSYGALIQSIRTDDFEEQGRRYVEDPLWSFPGALARYAEALDEAGKDLPNGWILVIRVFEKIRGRGVGLTPPVLMLRLNAAGIALDGPGAMTPFIRELGREGADQISKRCSLAFLPMAFALSLLHCKNVRTREREDERIPSEKARDLRAGIPELKFKTLDIDPMRRVLATEGDVARNGIKKALHICRGHFSEYSEERPLFGKYAGRFWIPSHVRGTTESGQVVKDYRIKAPRSA